jgi:hypothetical protein
MLSISSTGTTPTPTISSATYSTSGGSSAAGTGRRPTTTCSRPSSRAPRPARASSSCPATTTRCCAPALGTHFGGIEVVPQATFVAADGRRYLVTHGDQFDAVIVNAKWLAHVGDRAYEPRSGSTPGSTGCAASGAGSYWSLSNWAKQQVKQAVNYISEYEEVLAEEARRGGYDGIICGHIHAANLREIDGLAYVNTGDWVESCTAVAERDDGTLELIDWAAVVRRREAVHRAARRGIAPAPQPRSARTRPPEPWPTSQPSTTDRRRRAPEPEAQPRRPARARLLAALPRPRLPADLGGPRGRHGGPRDRARRRTSSASPRAAAT